MVPFARSNKNARLRNQDLPEGSVGTTSQGTWKTEAAMKAVLGGLAVLALAVGSASAQETKVAIGISGWTGFAPLTLAKEAGIFKKNGLDVTIKKVPPRSIQKSQSPSGVVDMRGSLKPSAGLTSHEAAISPSLLV